MVRGINSFRDWFRGYEEQYVIIGGTACDLLMSGEGLTFRATKDIDLVLIVEAIDAAFRQRFWEYVEAAGYEHKDKSTGEPHFYRFTNPRSQDYPTMIELFTRKPNTIVLPQDALLTPIPIEEEIQEAALTPPVILLTTDVKFCLPVDVISPYRVV
ncbi:MAG: nucleotidyl transferase AbiEii/AbiGii toxin family protein [Clostridia bacterium]|nr:nucleotidyl transferase AbiEii/AbiGii toxin family protein [Clostridia bacterium]